MTQLKEGSAQLRVSIGQLQKLVPAFAQLKQGLQQHAQLKAQVKGLDTQVDQARKEVRQLVAKYNKAWQERRKTKSNAALRVSTCAYTP